jgi:hypothetical protein
LDQLTLTQLQEWEAYDRLDPIGSWREDFRMAFLASLITNLTISTHGKPNAKQTTLEEFMPDWDVTGPKKVKQQTVEEMKKVFEDIVNSQKKKAGIQPMQPPTKKQKNG